ncbi:MAG TPA: YceI family protein [Dehalococcoidia bacterium]|nr:YceI family protein [Dehalococcoidia bacterium]
MKKLGLIVGGLIVLGVLGVGALVVVTMLRDDDPELLTSAPLIPTAAASTTTPPSAGSPAAASTAPAATSTTTTAPAPAAATSGVLRFVVDPAQSSATYVVREKLARLPVESDAAGTTTDTAEGDVTGELFVTPQGLASTNKSTFKVDLNTLKSDEGLRDNFVRSNTLQTGQAANRYATFVIDSVTGFPSNYVENTEVSVTLAGQMTIKGITKPVAFEVKARRAGDILTATADTTFNMSEFGINPPNVPSARSFDAVRLQVVLVTKRATA